MRYGVGRVTEQALLGAGIRTVGDVQDYGGDLRALVGSFGPKLKQTRRLVWLHGSSANTASRS